MEVIGVPDDKITISWRSKSPQDEREVSVKLQRSAPKEVTLSVEGPGERMRYRIEVPQRSNVSIAMNAGDPTRYRNVRAAVTAGEITARPWQVDISGVGRSFNASGDGEYDLRAHILAGQVTIRSD
jgi:hypothetical protein